MRAWAKDVEKEDVKLGLPVSRVDAFLAECFEQFGNLRWKKPTSFPAKLHARGVRRPAARKRRRSRTRRTRGPQPSPRPRRRRAGDCRTLRRNNSSRRIRTALAHHRRRQRPLRARYGASASLITRHDMCVVFYCEAGLSNGKVDPDHRHSLGERGLLPLPSRIRHWNGNEAPAWNQPMSADTNVKHFFLYMGHSEEQGLDRQRRGIFIAISSAFRGSATTRRSARKCSRA